MITVIIIKIDLISPCQNTTNLSWTFENVLSIWSSVVWATCSFQEYALFSSYKWRKQLSTLSQNHSVYRILKGPMASYFTRFVFHWNLFKRWILPSLWFAECLEGFHWVYTSSQVRNLCYFIKSIMAINVGTRATA